MSSHEGAIDWNAVKAAGYDFAILQIGFRGYESGAIGKDDYFDINYDGAQAAGLKVGAYFFAQAVNDAEARLEAEKAIEFLDGRKLDLPLFYDPEFVLEPNSRTKNVSGETFTSNSATFCRVVSSFGYQAGVYATLLWEVYELDLKQLAAYPIWCADYALAPQTPYAFDYWQYSYRASVPGISGTCDANVMMVST